jgi:hypothetical protein
MQMYMWVQALHRSNYGPCMAPCSPCGQWSRANQRCADLPESVVLLAEASRPSTSPVSATPAAALARDAGGSTVATPSTPSPGAPLTRGPQQQAATPNTGCTAEASGTPATGEGWWGQ